MLIVFRYLRSCFYLQNHGNSPTSRFCMIYWYFENKAKSKPFFFYQYFGKEVKFVKDTTTQLVAVHVRNCVGATRTTLSAV